MIGLSELIVVIIIAIAVLKPEKLSEYTQNIKDVLKSAKDIREEAVDVVNNNEVKQAVDEVKEEIEEELL